MVCIYCGSKTTVTNSRSSKKSNLTWRRRSCSQCRAIFTTRETPDLESSLRVKDKADTLKPFLRDKLFISVFLTLSHRKTALTDATSLTDTILSTMLAHRHNGIITSSEIAEMTSKILQRFDPASAVHYSAHHSEDGK